VRVVLIHGAATGPGVWGSVACRLRAATDAQVLVPERPQSGDLDTEIAFLTPLCSGAHVVGVSGGATLGLELLARGVEVESAFLHEPAAGSLAPTLLAGVVSAFAAGGVEGFGATLYGPLWRRSMTTASAAVVQRELAMFSSFEPRPAAGPPRPTMLTVGEHSSAARVASVRALAERLHVAWSTLPGAGHAAHLEGTLVDPWLRFAGDVAAPSPGDGEQGHTAGNRPRA